MARSRRHPLPPDPTDVPLTSAERRFVDEYLVDLNATRAYRAAFPEGNYAAARVGGSTAVPGAGPPAVVRPG
jgi:hypothetical protein